MTDHVVESTSELSAFMKAGVMAGSERDTGFSSGGDEDDMSGLHSPSASEDSVEVQVTPISLRNKRKLAEPRKIQETGSTAPPKKRRFERIEETLLPDEDSRTRSRLGSPSPFRPWSSRSNESKTFSSTVAIASTPATSTVSGIPATSDIVTVAATTLSPPSSTRTEGSRDDGEEFTEKAEISPTRPGVGLEPGGSFERDRRQIFQQQRRDSRSKGERDEEVASDHPRLQEEPLSLVLRGEIPRVPAHPAVSGSYEGTGYSTERAIRASSTMDLPGPAGTAGPAGLAGTGATTSSHHRRSNVRGAASSSSSSSCRTDHSRQTSQAGAGGGGAGGGGQQRNYKNMTRERRIEANARERTRVHTISAAFDTLRRAIPAYSHNQKLSKLSVLRIACSYIMTLGKIIGVPEEESSNGASLGACVDLVSRTIQTEGKLRKRKED